LKKYFWLAFFFLLMLSLPGCATQASGEKSPPPGGESERAAVTALVEDFGSRLQAVSLLAPKEAVQKSIRENYGDLVTPALLAGWLDNPAGAPGRELSSPWPDRIEILSVTKAAGDEYKVKGEIIEVTSVEKVNGGAAQRRPVTLTVKKTGERWLIDGVAVAAGPKG
jgi:hypothetical protein